MRHWKKTEITTVETKPVVKDFECFINRWERFSYNKKEQPLLDKIIAKGGPVLGLFSKRYSNSKRLF
jgi:hypothetical protein